jgi:DNA-binding transcriptional regulator YhcF (GntR family)
MIISVDGTLALPVYEQICEQVVRMVVAGALEPGTRMPTIRQLAHDLQLAKGTVAKAYAQLEEASVLESFGHRGTFIAASAISPPRDRELAKASLHAAADAYVLAAHQIGVDLDQARAVLGERWGHLTLGEPG